MLGYMSKKAFTYATFLVAFVLLSTPQVLSASAFQSYTDGRYDESFRQSYSKALQGDPIASQIIGMILIEGKGSAKSDTAAGKRFLISSIDSGRAESARYLAKLYEDGKLLEQNLRTALRYYRKAEELGASRLGGKILALAKKVEGRTSKAACRRYSKSDKKLASLIAQCIEKGFLDGNPARYWLVSFDNGEIGSLVKAAKTLLKVKSASFDPKKIVSRLPRFDAKASRKDKKRLERIVLENGFSSKGCKAGKDAMGFEVKGDVDGCVLAAAAGDVKAISFAAAWWLNGEFGLTRNKAYAEALFKKIDSLPEGNFELDVPQILKGLVSDPRRHFERAMKFYQKDPVVYGKVVGAALQLEAQLIAQDRIQEFAKEQADVLKVLTLADLNTLEPYVIASIIKKKNVDYINFADLSSTSAIRNFNRIEFRKEWFSELLKLDQGTAKKLLTQYVDKSCGAINFALDNPSLLAVAELNKSPLLTQCLSVGKGGKSGPSFANDPVRAAAVLATKLNGPVGSQCEAFGEYLKNRSAFNDNFIGTLPAAVQNEEDNRLECGATNGAVALYSAKKFFSQAEKIKTGNFNNSGKGRVEAFTETFNLAKRACELGVGYGCGLAAFIIKNRPTKVTGVAGDENVQNVKQATARQLAQQGWSLNSIEAGAYLLDLTKSLIASEGQKRDRKKLFDDMMKIGGPAIEIRKHAQCIEKDGALGDVVSGFASILGGGKNCSSECVAVRRVLNVPELDIMSRDRGKKLLGRPACK